MGREMEVVEVEGGKAKQGKARQGKASRLAGGAYSKMQPASITVRRCLTSPHTNYTTSSLL